jgi:hypothetical protein
MIDGVNECWQAFSECWWTRGWVEEMWINPVCELADDDSASEFGGRQSSGSRGTPTGLQRQGAPRENNLPAVRCGDSFQPFYILSYSVDITLKSTHLSTCYRIYWRCFLGCRFGDHRGIHVGVVHNGSLCFHWLAFGIIPPLILGDGTFG